MSLSGALWQANAEQACAALGHPFVLALAADTLPLPAFQHYVGQDAYFLQGFARAYALALARSPDLDTLLAFAELVDGVRSELQLHAGYAAGWQVDLAAVTPSPATLAYTDFLLATAAVQSLAVTCAAMAPCMRLYAYLGSSLAEPDGATGRYAEWIRTYSDPAFEALAGRLDALLDVHAAQADSAAAYRAYARAMSFELAFFDEAWTVGRSPLGPTAPSRTPPWAERLDEVELGETPPAAAFDARWGA